MVGKGACAGHSEMQLMARLWKDSPGSLQWRPRLACPLECHKMVIRNGPHLLAWYILVSSVGKIRKQRESQEGSEAAVSSPQRSQEQPFWLMFPIGRSCDWARGLLGAVVRGRAGTENTQWVVSCSFPTVRSCSRAGQNWGQTGHSSLCSPLKCQVYTVCETDSCFLQVKHSKYGKIIFLV